MEFPFRSRPTTAAADDEENGRLRRFPDAPPLSQPHGHAGDANTSGVDGVLLKRRYELLLELHKGFMHQDMILRELMETERVMGLTGASGYIHNPVSALPRSQDYCHRWTPSVASWEAPLRSLGSSTAVWVPPVYSHVEGSQHAPEQTRPGNDAEHHREGRSSGLRTHPFSGYVELCRSPSKQTPVEETLVAVAAKAGINQMQHQEGRSSGVRTHPFNDYFELCRSLSKQTPVEETLVPVAAKAGINQMQHQEGRSSGVRTHPFNDNFELCHSPSKQTPVAGKAGIHQVRPSSGHQQAVVWEKIGVEHVHNMQQLHDFKNQSSEGRKAIDSAIEDSIKKPMQQRLQYKPVDQENAIKNEQKSTEFNEPTPEGTSAGVKRKLTAPSSPVKKQMSARQDLKEEVLENRWTCKLCQANCTSAHDYHSHLGGRRHRENEDARLYCTACDVQCNSEKMLASHRGGRRHRETLEGSDSD